MTEKSRRMTHREAVERVRNAESFALNLPIVGRVPIPRPEVVAYYLALVWLLLLVVQLLSVFIVIRGMLNTTRVMQYASPIPYLVFAAGATVGAGVNFRLLVNQMTREAEKVHVASAFVVAVIGISTASTSIYFAVQVMVLLAHDSYAIASRPAQSELAVKDLYGKAVYEILDAIPILKIPATIGWGDPIPRPALLGGIVLLLLKLVLIVGFARLFSRLWSAARTMRRNIRHCSQNEESSRDDEPAPASQDSDVLSGVGDRGETPPDTEAGEPAPDKEGADPLGPGQVP
jgi:hypothetical protein